MFALMNPPLKARGKKKKPAKRAMFGSRQLAKNSWFGNTEGHRAAAKKGWAGRRKKHGKKIKRASELRTPGGGRIFSVAANPKPFWPKVVKHNSFMGVNPYSSTNNSTRRHTMARKRRHTRFNMGFSSPKRSGSIFDAFKPNNLVGVTPILAGVIADGMLTKMASQHIPYTKKGLGSIALGLAGAGLVGLVGRYANKQLGDGLFVGGVVGTLGCAFQSFMQEGLKSFSLSGHDDDGLNPNPFHAGGFMGMGTFVSPEQVSGALQSESAMSQYALPATNAQFTAPMHHHGMHAQMQAPQTPNQMTQVSGMSDNDMGAIGAVMGQDAGGDMSGMM